jgi:hypothetical protein
MMQLDYSLDTSAAKLQLEELEHRRHCLLDKKLALEVFLEGSGTDDEVEILDSADEEEVLQEQIASITSFIECAESFEAASTINRQQQEDTNASQALAEALAARDRWDAKACAHDAAFARALSACDSQEWDERGDLLSQPLDIGPRPPSPGEYAVAVTLDCKLNQLCGNRHSKIPTHETHADKEPGALTASRFNGPKARPLWSNISTAQESWPKSECTQVQAWQ